MSKYILNLINQGEHQQLDFKHSISDSKKIARSLVAFTNTDGGRLLIGVKDNGAIVGVKTDEEYYMVDAAANIYCKPSVKFETKIWEISGKTVLEIKIPEILGDNLYKAPDKNGDFKVFIRVNDENIIVNNIWIKAWQRKQFGKGVLIRYNKPERVLFEYLEKNKKITISKFKKIAKISQNMAKNIIVNLVVLNIIKIDFSDNQVFYSIVNEE